MTDQAMRTYIQANPQICFGKPVFRGTRIPVYLVLELLEAGIKPEEIVSADYYPRLNLKHVQASLHYATRLVQNQQTIALGKS